MKKYKFIEEIPLTGYAFEIGDEINVRKTLDNGKYRWEQYKIASDSLIYPASIQKEEWGKLDELTPEVLEKLVESYTNAEIDQMISEGVISATSGLVIVKGTGLPEPNADVAFAIVGQGVYTKAGQPNIVVPTNYIGILLWEKPLWSLGATQEVPNNANQKIEEQKGIPGGIAPLDTNAKVPSQHIDAYTKTETNAKDALVTTELSKKVDKVAGKSLSTNDYVNDDKLKVGKLTITGDGKMVLTNNGEYVKFSGGSGSGFYNVTTKLPLAPGMYYTLDSAVEAVVGQDLDDADKIGMIITFETAEGVWDDYRFIGDIGDFSEVAFWQQYTIKDIIRGVILNGEELVKDSADKVHINAETTVDQTIDPNSTNAVSGAAVASEFASLASKYGTLPVLNESGEGDEKVYSFSLLNENGEILGTTAEWSGGGGGGAVATTKIVLSKITENKTVKVNDDVVLEFMYDHIDTTSQSSTGLQGNAKITITSGATIVTRDVVLVAGQIHQILVNKELKVGSNSIRVRVEVDNGESVQVSSLVWSVLVVNLILTSTYYVSTVTQKGNNINIPFTLTGSGNKNVKCYVNGVLHESRSVSTSTATGSFIVPTDSLPLGNVSVQIVAELELSTGVIKSNSIYYDLILTQAGYNQEIVATRFNFQDGRIIESGDRPVLVGRQLENINITYAVYNPSQVNKIVTVTVNGVVIASSSLPLAVTNTIYRPLLSGSYNGSINAYTFGVEILPSSINITEPTDNLVYKFIAQGRANTDVNRNTWTSNSTVTATLSNVKFSGDGWTGNAVKVTDNGRITLNHKPLSLGNATTQNSFAFQMKIRNTEVADDLAKVVSCLDSDGTGFYITPTEATFVSFGKSTASMKLATGEVYNIAFVSFPIAAAGSSEYERINSNMIYLYINGKIVGGAKKANSDSIYQSNAVNVTIGANDATTEVYNIRHYNRYLSDSEVLDLYLIDLDNVEQIIKKYNDNAIVDGNGNVSVDSLPDDARYMIITGNTAGLPTVIHAAIQNNKNTRYDVTEILHIHKAIPSLNFKLIGGCIRLQGTSSLAYPIKNYRFYIKNSSKVAGELYIGVDENGIGGTLSTTHKWSFRNLSDSGKRPIPVDAWCLKADYAESSSSHNTGMARLVNTTLVKAGELTPPQKHVSPNYPYDVRTTIDGEPCYLFYRASIGDAPVFLGKYNLNNDKSTEDVFGFKGIWGYHLNNDGTAPSSWITNKFAGINPTECWEFLNNDYPMGKYLNDDFDAMVEVEGKMIPNWMRVFEARFIHDENLNEKYEAGTLKPYYLERLVKWVKSTQGNPTKFRNEIANYFDVNYLCDYFIFTQIFGAVDQMVKNAMLAFYYNPDVDKVLAYYIFYDNDTILGVRNDGRLKYHWDITRQTIDPEFNRPAYMGHDSILWNNLETNFTSEIGDAYRRIRARSTNTVIFKIFNEEQSDRFPERIFNIDALNKYVVPLQDGYNYIESMQGDRKSHRIWWLTNRLNLFDARYNSGDYRSTDLSWKGNSQAGATIKATPSRHFYFSLTRESAIMASSEVQEGVEWSYVYNQDANIGTIFHFYGGAYTEKLNFSEWGGFTDLNIPRMPMLEELILGMTGKTYGLSGIQFTDKLPMVKKLVMTNYTAVPTLDLTGMPRLQEFHGRGMTNLTTINFANGANIELLVLPQNFRTLKLTGFARLTDSNIQFPDGNTVENLVVDESPLINWETLLAVLSGVQNIRITGLDVTENKNWLDRFKDYGGIDADGNIVSTPRLVGSLQLITYLDDAVLNEYRLIFPELQIKQPEYSVYEYDWQVLDSNPISNPDNRTGARFGNTYVASGHIKNILNGMYRCLGKQEVGNEMSIFPLHNENSNYFATSKQIEGSFPAVLDGSQGDVFVYVPKYWYKGISDYETRKHYALYASTKPSQPNLKVIKRSDITFNINGRALLTNYSTLMASFQVNDSFRVIRVDVEGYNLVEFPTIDMFNTLYCNIFTNVDDVIISKVGPNKGYDFVNGASKYICPVPQGAKYLYITCLTSFTDYTFTGINLTKSNNIFDLATWVETTEVLHGAFTTSINDNKLKSISSSTVSTSQVPYSTSLIMANSRNMDILRYEEYKNLQNLLVFNYGSLIPEVKLGSAGSGIPGTTALMGVTDTYARNGVTTRPIGQQNPETYPTIASTNFKGLEDIFTLTYSIRGILMSYNYGAVSPVNIWLSKSGDKKILFSALPYASNPTGIPFGKVLWQQGMYHIPILQSPAGQLYNTNWARNIYTFGYEFGQFIHFSKNSDPLNLDVVGRVRLMFDGKVSRVSNLSEFLNKKNNF